jgi:hypothetical protein
MSRAAWRRDRQRAALMAAVVLLHAALLWPRPEAGPAPPRARPAVVVRLLARPAPAPAPAPAARPAPARPAAPSLARASVPRVRPAPAVRAAAVPPAVAADPPAAPVEADRPASAPTPAVPGLDTQATALAIREIARSPGLAARAGRAGTPERPPGQRLGEGIAQGARGDCLKGEYLGAGMGVLSLPFLAAAALRDQCRR